jgi:hypothetical protein
MPRKRELIDTGTDKRYVRRDERAASCALATPDETTANDTPPRRRPTMTDDRSDKRADSTGDPLAHPDDAGAYVGRKPEREAETIPGGIGPDDERIAAHSTQSGGVRDETVAGTARGHREGRPADDDLVRESGEDR